MASKPGPIPAGGKDKISVVVNTRDKGGQSLHKTFTVFTNDPKHSRIVLEIIGKVVAFVDIHPPYVKLNGRQGDPLSAPVRMTPHKEYPLTITDVKVNGDQDIQVALQPLGTNPPRDGYQLMVTCTRTTLGSFRGNIEVHTALKQKRIIRIPFNGRIRARPSDGAKSPSPK